MKLLEISMTALPEFTPGIEGRVKGRYFPRNPRRNVARSPALG